MGHWTFLFRWRSSPGHCLEIRTKLETCAHLNHIFQEGWLNVLMHKRRVHTPHPDRQPKRVDNSDNDNDILNSELSNVLVSNDSMESEQEDDKCAYNGPQAGTFLCEKIDTSDLAYQVGFLLHKYDEINNLTGSRIRSFQFRTQQNDAAKKLQTHPGIESSPETVFCPYCHLSSTDDILELYLSSIISNITAPKVDTFIGYHPPKDREGTAEQMLSKNQDLYTSYHADFRSFQEKKKRQVQTELLATVLGNSLPMRSYCCSAQKLRMLHQSQADFADQNEDVEDNSLQTVPCFLCQEKCKSIIGSLTSNCQGKVWMSGMIQFAIDSLLEKVPHINSIIQIAGSISEYNVAVILSLCHLSVQGLQLTITWTGRSAHQLFHFFAVDAAVRTTEVLASSMQSVAEGTIAASVAIQHYFPSGGGTAPYHHVGVARVSPTRSFLAKIPSVVNMARGRGDDITNKVLSDRLYRKLSKIDSTSKVISYLERHDEVLTTRQKQRVQRLMHYEISLRPFVATVIAPKAQIKHHDKSNKKKLSSTEKSSLLPTATTAINAETPASTHRHNPFSNHDWHEAEQTNFIHLEQSTANGSRDSSSHRSSPSEESQSMDGSSPFLCTPKSFPPTPWSRSMVLARGSSAAEDVVFFAREHLRVEDALTSSNEKTRSMALALREGKRLAVFNADHASSGIELSSGQHCATKVGNELYCTTRCMVPVSKNCFVYFEMSVWNPTDQASMPPLLSIGLSTLEMPTNHLVGSWKSSVALLSTGKYINNIGVIFFLFLFLYKWFLLVSYQRSNHGRRTMVQPFRR
jgi:hypothetical protein